MAKASEIHAGQDSRRFLSVRSASNLSSVAAHANSIFAAKIDTQLAPSESLALTPRAPMQGKMG